MRHYSFHRRHLGDYDGSLSGPLWSTSGFLYCHQDSCQHNNAFPSKPGVPPQCREKRKHRVVAHHGIEIHRNGEAPRRHVQ